MLLTNPVVVSVLVMIILCLFNLNIVLALLVAALSAGLTAGIAAGTPFMEILSGTMSTLIGGMGGNSETALSYFLLGVFAVAIGKTGLADIACKAIAGSVKGHKLALVLCLAIIACLSQNLVPIHIAFIPILIPPLLGLFNDMKVDRRQVACALAFGLKAPYVALPLGFGLIFYNIIAKEMTANGIQIEAGSFATYGQAGFVTSYTWILGLGMVAGLILSVLIAYNRPRNYADLPIANVDKQETTGGFTSAHYMTFISIFVAFALQLWTGSLPIGIITGILLMIVTGALKWKEIDSSFRGGIEIMGLIAFVMLIAAGYGKVLRETKSVEHLVNAVVGLVGGDKTWGAFLMLGVGLLVTMGIGTSFGTIPVVAAIYCPLALELGFSAGATACLIAAAAALGDAGSPASDTTLGPTAGLNADGQHNHIWDTCVPTFLFYNIPLFIAGLIGATIF
jgi:predicted histidine transporter YuiF (NhaC family)